MHALILYICIAKTVQEPCVYNEPEHGLGHVAYSYSLPFFDLAREAVNECETVHGPEQCEVFCWSSR